MNVSASTKPPPAPTTPCTSGGVERVYHVLVLKYRGCWYVLPAPSSRNFALTDGLPGPNACPCQDLIRFTGAAPSASALPFREGAKEAVLDATDRVRTAGARVAEAHGSRRFLGGHSCPVYGAVCQFHGRSQGAYHIRMAGREKRCGSL